MQDDLDPRSIYLRNSQRQWGDLGVYPWKDDRQTIQNKMLLQLDTLRRMVMGHSPADIIRDYEEAGLIRKKDIIVP
jgi:hypothetical protein